MNDKKGKNEITVKSIFLKLLDAIFGIIVGICKGFKYIIITSPFIFVAFAVLLIFFNSQTIEALDKIRQFLIDL